MIVYRISSYQFHRDLSGKGAELAGGRWNSRGIPVLYTAQSRALAMAEVAVHIPYVYMAKNYQILTLEVPEGSIEEILPETLPANWRAFPYSSQTQLLGDRLISSNEKLVIKAPSAVVDGDFNYLLNPGHELMQKVKIIEAKTFLFDSRFFRQPEK
jgi:RES domain-containing protein